VRIVERVRQLGFELLDPPSALALYRPRLRSGNSLHISGQLSTDERGNVMTGKAGASASLEVAQNAARRSALMVLAHLAAEVENLEEVEHCIELVGYVNASTEFVEHLEVVNAASQLLVDVLGSKGSHTRVAVGVASLPRGALTEISAKFTLR